MKELIVSYFRLLKQNHLSEILVVPASLITIVIDVVKSGHLISLDLVAISLLSVYLLFVFFDNYRLANSITRNVNSSYSICLDKKEKFFSDSLRLQVKTLARQKVNLKKVNGYFRIIASDWQFFDPNKSLPTEWKNTVTKIYDHFFTYTQRLPIETKFHLFVLTPPPIALALGYTIGKYKEWIVYQFVDPYYRRISTNAKGTEALGSSSFACINVAEENVDSNQDITIVLTFVSKSEIEIPRMNNRFIEITPKFPRILNESSKAPLLASEIQQVINEKTRMGKRIHLFPGVPIHLAFLVGRSIQENAAISVYNPNRDTKQWECVFALDQLGQF